MIELLSLPRRPHLSLYHLGDVNFKSGLPINSLPGWEHIPLNSKLPMLKCPGNQVIFSKNKIGQSILHDRRLKHEFDPSVRDSLPEYNPLQDSNLQRFYANERNLKRLRENGEITQNNDVICNLKEFNEYRQELHKTQLYYILMEITRMQTEQHDRALIDNAEKITNDDYRNLMARKHTYTDIRLRKRDIDRRRSEHFKRLYEKTLERFAFIHVVEAIRQTCIEHKKVINQLKMEKHREVRNDLQRKQLIALKKLFQFKKERLKKNLKNLREQRIHKANQDQYASWNKRLAERIAYQERIQELLASAAQRKKYFIQNHRERYLVKWERLNEDIKIRAAQNRARSYFGKIEKRKRRAMLKEAEKQKSAGKQQRIGTRAITQNATSANTSAGIEPGADIGGGGDAIPKNSVCEDFQSSFDNLLDEEVCMALHATLDMEDNVKLPFESDDPIYKAAKFIMVHILAKFDKDLSYDQKLYKTVYSRMSRFFDEAKKFVLFRATQIISSIREWKKGHNDKKDQRNNITGSSFKRSLRSARVSFCNFSTTIGTSSYSIHPSISIKHVSTRKPTPAGSLDSLVVDSTTSLANKVQAPHLCRRELIFIEHYLTKFKRKLIVGVGRRVFAAIQCHFESKIMKVRRELLDMDRHFLLKQSTKSILSYAMNPMNYESMLRLCICTLSNDIIFSLQKQLLKPSCPPKRLITPKFNVGDHKDSHLMCMFCDH